MSNTRCCRIMAGPKCVYQPVSSFPGSNFQLPRQMLLARRISFRRSLRSARKFIPAAQPDHDAQKSTSKLSARRERSEAVNQELLIFLYQLDLATRLQRALNQDQYDAAQIIREKIAELEKAVAEEREKKASLVSAKNQAQDKELALLRLRAKLTEAVEEENYVEAAELRDSISKAEAESLAASAKALAYQNLKYSFRLGQKVRHKQFGYRGVICGMDPVCCESLEWSQSAGVGLLPGGRNQPFYQVLVDVEQEPDVFTAYVAEANLEAPVEPDLDALKHPYIYILFFGMNTAGDYIPTKQLREKYGVQREQDP